MSVDTPGDLPTVASGCGPVAHADHAIARFDLAIPRFTLEFAAHEEEEFRDALNGARWRMAVDEYAQELRRILKHGKPGRNRSGLDAARELLFKILEEEGLRLYD